MALRFHALVLAALALVAGRASVHGQVPIPHVGHADSPEVDHERMVRLIGEVETHLRRIDHLLDDAGAGDRAALAKVGSGGLGELLKRSHDDGRQVVDDIDRILELADHVHPPGT